MKFFFCILTLAALSARAQAQGYSITKSAIAGGGGLNSTGGTYSVSGTIGQPDASGPLSGGSYTLSSGAPGVCTAPGSAQNPPTSV